MLNRLKDIIDSSNNIVFFGGAGVSTESDIPDFRSEKGLYKAVQKYHYRPETIISHTFFMKNPKIFYEYYKENLIYTDAKPNNAHKALAKLEERGKLKAVVTQNIDNLHQMAGSKEVVELHGSVYRNYCMSCGEAYDIDFILDSNDVPRCTKCGDIVKPDVVLYEEGLDGLILKKAVEYVSSAEVLIIGGTSLVVYPAASLIQYFNGKYLVLINKEETSYDSYADLVINEPIGEVMKGFL
ncbi:NAD-dependent protein deacylase [Vallitalea guaymasensis]|uniref:NAD-dependent protein deacetylase n=1 Tax=Vallitalea guaymasensis TaxID=1185412 RepID=A0A8J8MBI5_9FIRM|nr:NAD-dependent protein deacylase [Vallitalea guaymasensis]QUH29862.1 NAD-dependent protein deacylase [Vallitalea guaymasensis]